ncbi:MAG: hypothetical protein R2784_14055 [Saprospiraceae bacterium]
MIDSIGTIEVDPQDDGEVPFGYALVYLVFENGILNQISTDTSILVDHTGNFEIHTLVYNPNQLNLSIFET